jgi:hypothetical protein
MVKILGKSKGNVFGFKIIGELTDEDMNRITPMMIDSIKDYGSVNMLIDMTEYGKQSTSRFFDDISLAIGYRNDIDRISIVGNKLWQKILAKTASVFFKGQRYFEADSMDDAWKWVSHG